MKIPPAVPIGKNERYIKPMSELSNYRAVGLFDLVSAPVTPIGSFDAEQFKLDVKPLLEKGSAFIGVDATGLDFLYSDACSAFCQVQQKLAEKNGAFAVLTDHDDVVTCLKKANLDKTIHVFRKEADMVAFSMKEDEALHSAKPAAEEIVEEVPTAKSNNRRETASMGSLRRRVTGRFTKSFNAIRKDAKTIEGGLENPFQEEKSSSSKWIWVVVGLLVVAAATAFAVL